MKATPGRLVVSGLAVVAVAVVVVMVNVALVQADALTRDGGVDDALTIVGAAGFWLGVVAVLAGGLAWIVKVGVRAARES